MHCAAVVLEGALHRLVEGSKEVEAVGHLYRVRRAQCRAPSAYTPALLRLTTSTPG